MKKTEKKKLTLSKETLADLEAGKLNEVGGGLTGISGCYTRCPGCPPWH